MIRPPAQLCKLIGYHFNNKTLLDEALTHRSVGSKNNERLEFLGDAVLGFVITSELYRLYPQAGEGDLSRYRASLVKGERLAQIAQTLELGEYLHLGPGELKSGGFRRNSILANALEAVIGAIYLDGGMAPVQCWVDALYRELLPAVGQMQTLKDPKTRLQEYLQSRKLNLPLYEVLDTRGDSHDQIFTVSCQVADLQLQTSGEGASRRKAEQAAATQMLTRIGVDK